MNNRILADRKGLSPLIATVLLIAFAVAIGTVIMNWGIGATTEGCGDVAVDFSDAGGTPAVCVDVQARHLQFDVTNNGDAKVDFIRIDATDQSGNYEGKQVPVELEIGASADSSIQLSTGQPTNIYVQLVPGITDEEGHQELCVNSMVRVNEVPTCQQ